MSEVASVANFFHLHDANKNVMQMTDAAGIMTEIYSYTPFGKAVATGGSAHFFGFSSEVSEPETGLNYYNYRYLASDIGRWTKRDPLEEYGAINVYLMVNNNLPNQTDYLGTIPVQAIIGGILGVISSAAYMAKDLLNTSMQHCKEKCLPNECKSCCSTRGNAAIASLTVAYMSAKGACLTLTWPSLISSCWFTTLGSWKFPIYRLYSPKAPILKENVNANFNRSEKPSFRASDCLDQTPG